MSREVADEMNAPSTTIPLDRACGTPQSGSSVQVQRRRDRLRAMCVQQLQAGRIELPLSLNELQTTLGRSRRSGLRN